MTTVDERAFTPARSLPNGELFYSAWGLLEFQADHLAHAYLTTEPGTTGGVIAVWDTGLGKGEEIHEPVLTPGGWIPIGDIVPGDRVIGSDGLSTRVMSVHPQGVRPLYRVAFSDGSWTTCDENHLWTVRYWGNDRSSGKQVRTRREATYSIAELIEVGIKTPAGRRKFSIPMVKPVQYRSRKLPVPAYQLGVILGDGHIRPDGTIHLSTDKEIIETFGLPGEVGRRPGCYHKSTRKYAAELIELRLAGKNSHEKFVPREYLHAPEADRRALLAGLLDTDGSPIEDGGAEFCSTSEALVDAVIELTESLGGIAHNKTSRVTRYTHNGEVRQGRESWRVNVKLNEQPFRLARKMIRWHQPTKYEVGRWFESIERIDDGESVCIKVEAADELYVTRHHLVTHNTLLGIAMATYLYADDKIDLVMVVAEKNKITDWRDDFERFSALAAHRYHGAGRQKRLAKADPHVLITTYETGRTDLMHREANGKRSRGSKVDGPLVKALDLRNKRVLWIFDEVTRLRGRGSELHQAYDYILRELRKGTHHQRVLGLTATPMERDYEDAYNVGRIVCPTLMPTVDTFERAFTRGLDRFNRYIFRRDTEHLFAALFQQTIIRKRKTDADVIDQFPKQVEESIKVELNTTHRSLYNAVSELCDSSDEQTPMERATAERQLYTALRMTAGHPMAHLHSTSVLSQAVTQAVGDGLATIKSSKTEELIARLKPIVKGQGAQAVVFTFFGNTVLVELAADLRRAGFSVAEYHGSQSLKKNDDAKDRFKAGESEILLTSDAGSRGMNLQNAEYVFEYESALTFANRTQRINRIHRIDSEKPIVTCFTMIAEDTIEEGLINLMLTRNEHQDKLLGDEDDGSGFIDAAARRALLNVARKKR